MIRLTTLFLLLFSSTGFAETLCPTEKEHDLVIGESEYTMDEALKAINNLDRRIPELISEHEEQRIANIEKSLENNEPINTVHLRMTSALLDAELEIGLPNRLSIIRGTLLKQNVMILKNGSNERAYEKALEEFCDYVKGASYVD